MTRPFKVLRINHIGIAPKDCGKTRSFFCDDLGLEFIGEETVQDQETVTVMFSAGKDTPSRLETLIPLKNGGPIAGFLAKKGSGLHHVALEVDDVQKAVDYLLAKKVRMIDQAPRHGAHQTLIAFVHPESAGGILVELVQSSAFSG